MTIATD